MISRALLWGLRMQAGICRVAHGMRTSSCFINVSGKDKDKQQRVPKCMCRLEAPIKISLGCQLLKSWWRSYMHRALQDAGRQCLS